MKKQNEPTDVQGLIRARANQMTWRWRPVQRKADNQQPVSTTLVRSIIEEIAFYPSKVWTLIGVFATKARTNPGLLTRLYMGLGTLVLALPLLITQAVLWQSWRTIKALWHVCRGSVAYVDKDNKTKNK